MWLLGGAAAAAHEMGAVRAYAEFKKDGTYAVDCIIDREHLPAGFSAGARYPPGAGAIAGVGKADEAGIGRLLAQVADQVHVVFDGVDARPELRWVDPNPAAAELILRLSGRTPPRTALFGFSNDARLGTYLLTVQTEGAPEPLRQWQQGGEESFAITLPAAVVPAERRFRSARATVLVIAVLAGLAVLFLARRSAGR